MYALFDTRKNDKILSNLLLGVFHDMHKYWAKTHDESKVHCFNCLWDIFSQSVIVHNLAWEGGYLGTRCEIPTILGQVNLLQNKSDRSQIGKEIQLVRQSQIVRSVVQDCQYGFGVICCLYVTCSRPKRNLQLLFVKTVGVQRWISFILYSLIRWISKRDNFIFFNANISNLILLFFSQSLEHDIIVFWGQENMIAFFLLEKNEYCYWLMKRMKRNDFVPFKRQIFTSSINNY